MSASRSVMTARSTSLAMGLVMSASLLAIGCGSRNLDRPDPSQIASGPNVAGPRDGVYLRASFDDDPSMFIGRFISDELAADLVDENRGVQTACSQFIKYREVRAAGTFDEYYQSSTSVKASLGIDTTLPGSTAPTGNAAVGNQSGTEVRVSYQLTRKLVANIEDHAGFTACCEAAAGACSGKYIGEFWSGTGTLYQNAGRATEVGVSGQAGPKVQGIAYQGEGDVQVADGWAWRRAMTFDDVYFAFRVMDAEIGGCGWVDRPPRSDAGQYFVGISPPAATQDIARTFAMRNARSQVVNYLGEYIQSQSTSRASLQGYLEDETIVAAAAEGLAARVKDERYCPAETLDTPDGRMYIVKVLAFFPNDEAAEAAREVVQAVAEKASDDEDIQELQKELEEAEQ